MNKTRAKGETKFVWSTQTQFNIRHLPSMTCTCAEWCAWFSDLNIAYTYENKHNAAIIPIELTELLQNKDATFLREALANVIETHEELCEGIMAERNSTISSSRGQAVHTFFGYGKNSKSLVCVSTISCVLNQLCCVQRHDQLMYVCLFCFAVVCVL